MVNPKLSLLKPESRDFSPLSVTLGLPTNSQNLTTTDSQGVIPILLVVPMHSSKAVGFGEPLRFLVELPTRATMVGNRG